MSVEGKVAVVSGAAQGIGRAYARVLAEHGATVAVADIRKDGANETADLIQSAGGRAVAYEVDVSDKRSVDSFASEVATELGPCQILINNAAIFHSMRTDSVLDVDIEYWRKMFSVNLDGALLMTQAFAPQMIERNWGRIVNQTSVAAYTGVNAHYGASKLALIALTMASANALGAHNITVNAIAPGPIDTEAMSITVPQQLFDAMMARTPIKKRVSPDEIAHFLLLVLSDEAFWMTGQTLVFDGGFLKRI